MKSIGKHRLYALVLLIFSIYAFSLEISPSFIYQIDTNKYQFTYSFFIRNDFSEECNINIEIIDFITDGRSYTFDDLTYKYSLRRYVKLNEEKTSLGAGELKEIFVSFDVSQDFPGATGIFALKISQEGKMGGKIQVRLNYIVPFFVRFSNIPVYQSINIKEVEMRDLSKMPDETYGRYGTLITLEIENNGNIAFIPKGSIQISSKEMRTVITEVPVDSFDLVVFPEKKTFYTFYVPFLPPRGTIDFSIYGQSYGMDFYTSYTLKSDVESIASLYSFSQSVILFSEKSRSAPTSFDIFNLSPNKEKITVDCDATKFSIVPKTVTIYPYRSTTVMARTLEKDFSFDGDRLYKVRLLNEKNEAVQLTNEITLVLRGKSISASAKASSHIENDETTLYVENNGNCVIEVSIFYESRQLSEESVVLLPNQSTIQNFKQPLRTSQIRVKYKALGTNQEYEITPNEFTKSDDK